MAQSILTWIPINNANSLSQNVDYKLNSAGTYTLFSNVAANISTETVTGLTDNLLYTFRVSNICAVGGASPSNVDEGINLTCPVVTLDSTYNSVSYSFPHLGGSINSYDVQLMNSAGNAVLETDSIVSPSGTITGVFNTGITDTTTYKVRVIVHSVGLLRTYSKTCATQDIITPDTPSCDAPTNVTATMS